MPVGDVLDRSRRCRPRCRPKFTEKVIHHRLRRCLVSVWKDLTKHTLVLKRFHQINLSRQSLPHCLGHARPVLTHKGLTRCLGLRFQIVFDSALDRLEICQHRQCLLLYARFVAHSAMMHVKCDAHLHGWRCTRDTQQLKTKPCSLYCIILNFIITRLLSSTKKNTYFPPIQTNPNYNSFTVSGLKAWTEQQFPDCTDTALDDGSTKASIFSESRFTFQPISASA